MDAFLVPKSSKKYFCETCDYTTSRYSQYHRHLSTAKHLKSANGLQKVPKKVPQVVDENIFVCACGSEYKFRQGLQKHKIRCFYKPDTDLLITLFTQQMKENEEVKKLLLEQQNQIIQQNQQIIELSKDKQTIIMNTNCNNSKTNFNLQLFLNEQCKDALNLGDFINSLQLQLSDLENTSKVGYVEGISKIFINGLKELDLCKRPVHCSDIKREILYVKDEDVWFKEDDENKKLKNAIQLVTHKHIKQIPSWVEENPSCKDSSSNKNDEYMKIVSNSMMGESSEEQCGNVNKIISKLAKEVAIQK
jgi:hypothetical protein